MRNKNMNKKLIDKIKKDEEYSYIYGKLLSSRVYPEFFNIANNESVVNIGCGNGPQAIMYADKYKEMAGIDINQERIDRSIKIMERFEIKNYKPKYGNVEELDFSDNHFEKALAIDIVEHVQDPRKMCKEINRVLKDGGEMLMTFPAMHDKFVDFASWIGRVFFRKKRKEKRSGWNPDDHNNEYDIKKWIEIVEDCGFKLKRSRATTMFPPLHLYGLKRFWYSNEIVHRIDSFFCKLFMIKNGGQTLLCVFVKEKV